MGAVLKFQPRPEKPTELLCRSLNQIADLGYAPEEIVELLEAAIEYVIAEDLCRNRT